MIKSTRVWNQEFIKENLRILSKKKKNLGTPTESCQSVILILVKSISGKNTIQQQKQWYYVTCFIIRKINSLLSLIVHGYVFSQLYRPDSNNSNLSPRGFTPGTNGIPLNLKPLKRW